MPLTIRRLSQVYQNSLSWSEDLADCRGALLGSALTVLRCIRARCLRTHIGTASGARLSRHLPASWRSGPSGRPLSSRPFCWPVDWRASRKEIKLPKIPQLIASCLERLSGPNRGRAGAIRRPWPTSCEHRRCVERSASAAPSPRRLSIGSSQPGDLWGVGDSGQRRGFLVLIRNLDGVSIANCAAVTTHTTRPVRRALLSG
jgi:hypothetical protein